MALTDKKEKNCLFKAPYSTISSQAVRAHSSIPQLYSTPAQFGNSPPKLSPLPEQKELPNAVPSNSTSDENEDELIKYPYDSRISYIWEELGHQCSCYGLWHLQIAPSFQYVSGRSSRYWKKWVRKTALILEMIHHDKSARENCLVLW